MKNWLSRITLSVVIGFIAVGMLVPAYQSHYQIPIASVVSSQDMIAVAMQSVVHIRAGDPNDEEGNSWEGSGVYVGNNLFMTARHVIKGQTEFKITFENGLEYKADWAVIEPQSDVGFIHVEGMVLCSPLVLNIQELRRGDTVYILGNPFGLTLKFSVSKGIVSAVNRDAEGFFGDKLIFQTDAASYPGDSGGPVINELGEVVGILVGGYGNVDNLSLCIPARICQKSLEICLKVLEMKELK